MKFDFSLKLLDHFVLDNFRLYYFFQSYDKTCLKMDGQIDLTKFAFTQLLKDFKPVNCILFRLLNCSFLVWPYLIKWFKVCFFCFLNFLYFLRLFWHFLGVSHTFIRRLKFVGMVLYDSGISPHGFLLLLFFIFSGFVYNRA